MAKKKVSAVVKIQIPAGQASPAPPVGTALGPHGIAIMDFTKAYNAQTENQRGTIVPVEITIYEDRSFTFVLKTPPAAVLIRAAAGLEKGSQLPGRGAVGEITEAQLGEIATTKLPDLNTDDLEQAKLQVAGTARSMGIRVLWEDQAGETLAPLLDAEAQEAMMAANEALHAAEEAPAGEDLAAAAAEALADDAGDDEASESDD
jgi:large subunit ribosomal protein L11